MKKIDYKNSMKKRIINLLIVIVVCLISNCTFTWDDNSEKNVDSSTNTSTDADLSALTVSPGTLEPAFSQSTYNYSLQISDDVTSISLTPISLDPLASMSIHNATVSSEPVSPTPAVPTVDVDVPARSNSIVVLVTSEDGNTTRSYYIAVQKNTGPIVVNHTNLNISLIPDEIIDRVKEEIVWIYSHASHGQQIHVGLGLLADEPGSRYNINYGEFGWPDLEGDSTAFSYYHYGLRIWDFNNHESDALEMVNNFPGHESSPPANFYGFMWCNELGAPVTPYPDWHNYPEMLDEYFITMENLEGTYPDNEVRFIYFTGPTDNIVWDGNIQRDEFHLLRYQTNEQIRSHVLDHPEENRILFDFADIECWQYNPDGSFVEGSYNTHEIDGFTVPVRHPDYEGLWAEDTHTNDANHIAKARALWWMFALLVGWEGP